MKMSASMRQLILKLGNLAINNGNSFTKNICNRISLPTPQLYNLSRQRFFSNKPVPQEVVDPEEDKKTSLDVIRRVNEEVQSKSTGRLFAIVHITGKQFKITEGDLIIIEGYWPPTISDKISLDKILMVGAKNFTLIGRPLVEPGIASVHATVIEKMFSHSKTHFRKKRRKQYKRIHFYRTPRTTLRINRIEIKGDINNPPDVTGLDHVIF